MRSTANGTTIATIGGGCFWCLEAIYDEIDGVVKVESGYSGGTTNNPTYEQVCSGNTEHAEVVQITFIPDVINYSNLLEVFFNIHDPTTLDRQGADVGSQYRSIIFYHDEHQKIIAEQKLIAITASKLWKNPVVTQITELTEFYKAEDHHQDYYRRNPYQGYCQIVIEPKISKFRKQYMAKLKK